MLRCRLPSRQPSAATLVFGELSGAIIALMEPDSTPGSLPLAEAMVTWCDSSLVAAIRRAEAAVPAAHLHRYGRPTLDTLASQRRPPQRFRPYTTWGPILAVDDAWEHLFGSLRLQIERGEVALDGVPSFKLGPRVREKLPSDRAAEFVFDPGAGVIFVGGQTFLSVRASLMRMVTRPTAAAAASVMQAGVLPLREALIAWSDPTAVETCKRLEWLYRVREKTLLLPTPYLRSEQDAEPPLESFEAHEIQVPRLALTLAWIALEQDFRSRIEGGELRPMGVQTFPLALTVRESIPHLWAADLQFDFHGARLHVVRHGTTTHSFIAVQVVRDVHVDRTDASRDEHAASYNGARRQTECGIALRSRSGGRKSEWPAVLEALRTHWDALFSSGVPANPPRWTDLARSLHRRMERARPKAGVRVPAEETVRKHLPEIYAQVLGEKGGLPPNDQ